MPLSPAGTQTGLSLKFLWDTKTHTRLAEASPYLFFRTSVCFGSCGAKGNTLHTSRTRLAAELQGLGPPACCTLTGLLVSGLFVLDDFTGDCCSRESVQRTGPNGAQAQRLGLPVEVSFWPCVSMNLSGKAAQAVPSGPGGGSRCSLIDKGSVQASQWCSFTHGYPGQRVKS